LRKRVQRASASAAASNERFLRRISAELHDGPVQELGAALLRMDRVVGQDQARPGAYPNNVWQEQLPAIQPSHAECHPGGALAGERPRAAPIGGLYDWMRCYGRW